MAPAPSDLDVRRRLRLFAIGLAIVALACIAGLIVNYYQQRTLKHHQDAIIAELKQLHRNERQIQRNQRNVTRLTIDTAAAICLEAFASDKGDIRLVRLFNTTGHISVAHNPTCQKAVTAAAHLILIDH